MLTSTSTMCTALPWMFYACRATGPQTGLAECHCVKMMSEDECTEGQSAPHSLSCGQIGTFTSSFVI